MRYLLLISLFSLSFLSNAQLPSCGTDSYYQKLFEENPGLEQIMDATMDKDVSSKSYLRGNDKMIIPVVFHVIHVNGSENIPVANFNAMINRLNEDYQGINSDLNTVRDQYKPLIASLNIEFRMARIDPDGNCTNGITRTYSEQTDNAGDAVKRLIQWNPDNYLNVWVVKSINNFGQSGMILGYATFPGGSAWRDGIVIRSDRIGDAYRTLTHEIGHYFGLYHPFQGGCSDGDHVDDTPPEAEAHFNCDFKINSCSTDLPDLPDMLENHMCYASCRVMFTKGQKDRMMYYLQGDRSNLYSKQNLAQTGTLDTSSFSCNIKADFVTVKQDICEQSTIKFTDQSNGGNQEIGYRWYFDGGTPATSTIKNPEIQYNQSGLYNVKLVISTQGSKDSLIKNELIVVFPDTGYQSPVAENFEGSLFDSQNWFFPDEGSQVSWQVTSKAGFISNHSIYLNNYDNKTEDAIYEFNLPPMSFAGLPDVALSFKYAYAKKDDASKDNLRVYVSGNCGESWSVRKFISPYKMPTVSGYKSSEYFPSDNSEWKEEKIDLNYYKGNPNIRIKFSFYTGFGNNIFIDDLNIISSVSIDENNGHASGFNIYPNPLRDYLFIQKTSGELVSQYTLSIYNMLGENIYNRDIRFEENVVKLNVNDLNILHNGIYFIKITEGNHIYEQKIFYIN